MKTSQNSSNRAARDTRQDLKLLAQPAVPPPEVPSSSFRLKRVWTTNSAVLFESLGLRIQACLEVTALTNWLSISSSLLGKLDLNKCQCLPGFNRNIRLGRAHLDELNQCLQLFLTTQAVQDEPVSYSLPGPLDCLWTIAISYDDSYHHLSDVLFRSSCTPRRLGDLQTMLH